MRTDNRFEGTLAVVVGAKQVAEQWRRVRDVLAQHWRVQVVSLDGGGYDLAQVADADVVMIADAPRSMAAGELVAHLRRSFELHAPRAPRRRQAGSSDGVFRREGDYWTIEHAGRSLRVRHCKGLHHLARLLAHPHIEVHALMLAMPPFEPTAVATASEMVGHRQAGLGDAGAVLDAAAKSAYRRRLVQLREARDDARRFGDHARIEALEVEMHALARELAAAIGLGGRDRRAAAPAERARVNVTRTIAAAIAAIGRYDPALARHLRATVRTGTYCCYAPVADAGVSWQVG
jgi:hypothetical protein